MGKHLHLAARQKRVWMFCAACIVVNVNVALHLDLCEKTVGDGNGKVETGGAASLCRRPH